MTPLTSAEPSGAERLLWLAALPLVAAIAWRLGTAPRTDLLGHWLAGWGGTLGACWLIARAAGGRGRAVVGAAAACIGLGAILESSVFALAGFDPLDFGAQSLGALLAAGAVIQARAGDPDADPADGASPLARNALGRWIVALSSIALAVGAVFAFA